MFINVHIVYIYVQITIGVLLVLYWLSSYTLVKYVYLYYY